ncbi:MAG TPA: ABC transporter ATP-binding protein [Candidatus Dormibacteraeota bacterium]|nr:ABC transporter ATP-binding protein [Candidatus Dormibacteraeota bacterium]
MGERIVVAGVCHSFGSRPVLERVTFAVAQHELLCVVGPSGCGKTTLLRIMAGLLRATSGEVRVGGQAVTRPSAHTAMVFQHFGLFPWKSVRANIAYGLANRGRRDPERVEALLRTMGLADAADRYPRQLSGGMRQRVGLARALAVEPEVLLMDEPFGSLDAITREQLQDELLRIWERDPAVTGVFITHDIDEAILLGDRVLAMASNPGRISREIAVPIPRPRTALAVRAHAAYPDLRAQIWEALR